MLLVFIIRAQSTTKRRLTFTLTVNALVVAAVVCLTTTTRLQERSIIDEDADWSVRTPVDQLGV